jgi:DNA-binding response OmpR family regulator
MSHDVMETAQAPATMTMETLLVVDDEEDLADLVAYHAEKNGFRVEKLANGLPVVATAIELRPAAIVLDLMLPGVDGLEVFKRLRAHPKTRDIPVVMLTAKADDIDRIVGLELGADDYVTKPFNARELMLRVKAVLRRNRPEAASGEPGFDSPPGKIQRAGPILLDPERHRVEVADEASRLTAIEFKLLEELMSRRGRVLTREHLLQNVWGYTHHGSARTVDTHVRRLRAKLGDDAARYIETIRGIGYRFCEDEPPAGPFEPDDEPLDGDDDDAGE